MLFSLLLGVAAIRFSADQTLVGTALNLLGPAAAVVLVRAINMAESADNVSSTVMYGQAKKAFLMNIGRFEFNWFNEGVLNQQQHYALPPFFAFPSRLSSQRFSHSRKNRTKPHR